jgi:ketosteroid isomerase-like protein
MNKVSIALAAALLAAGQTAAAQQPDVMVAVRQFTDAFNKGDIKAVVAACTDQTSIIDEFPPFEWNGPGSCAKWAADYESDAKKNGITDGIVTLGTPKHVDVAGDRAYVVIPSNYSYKQKGKPMQETGSFWTFVMQKGAAGWRIAGWSWGKN